MYDALWTPATVGATDVANRIAMAPMTRDRSTPEGVPTELNAEYYAQRASTGLIITEGTQPSDDGQGYLLTPGIYTDAHVAGWRQVTSAVHAAGGKIVIQLMHVGRVSHPDNTPHGRRPVAPSAITPEASMFTATGMQPIPQPRELSGQEVAQTVDDFREAAAAAITAGADGVEIHGANGYLIQQFLSDNTNHRTDAYGGSLDNRIRFAVEVATAVADEIGSDRTGFRISPGNTFNDIAESDTSELYPALAAALAPLQLAYLHIMHSGDDALLTTIRDLWPTTVILNRAGAHIATRVADVDSGVADLIAIGGLALANPDLVARLRQGGPLNEPDPSTFYGGGAAGYTDYPTWRAENGAHV